MASSYTSSSTKPLYRATQVVWYLLGVIEVLLVFRLALRLIGSNSSAGFTSFIYGVSYVFAAPFFSVFRVTPVAIGIVFEWTTLLAMFIYWVVAIAIVKLLLIGRPVSKSEAAVKLNDQE